MDLAAVRDKLTGLNTALALMDQLTNQGVLEPSLRDQLVQKTMAIRDALRAEVVLHILGTPEGAQLVDQLIAVLPADPPPPVDPPADPPVDPPADPPVDPPADQNS